MPLPDDNTYTNVGYIYIWPNCFLAPFSIVVYEGINDKKINSWKYIKKMYPPIYIYIVC